MKSCWTRFNWNLLLVLLVALAGCHSTPEQIEQKKQKKERSTISLHLETRGGGPNAVPIYRKEPVYVPVEVGPFLDLADMQDAEVIDYMGGFVIQLRFNLRGAMILDSTTAANKGRRIAVFSTFPKARWLAAPLITQRNETGVFTFTPDASKEEAERIVRGLNNAIKQFRKRNPI